MHHTTDDIQPQTGTDREWVGLGERPKDVLEEGFRDATPSVLDHEYEPIQVPGTLEADDDRPAPGMLDSIGNRVEQDTDDIIEMSAPHYFEEEMFADLPLIPRPVDPDRPIHRGRFEHQLDIALAFSPTDRHGLPRERLQIHLLLGFRFATRYACEIEHVVQDVIQRARARFDHLHRLPRLVLDMRSY